MSDHLTLLVTIGGSLATIVAALLGVWIYMRPSLKRRQAADEAIIGAEEVRDLGGGVIREGKRGLVAITEENSLRLAKVEEAVTSLTTIVANQKEINSRLDKHENRLNDHGSAIAALIATKFEAGAQHAMAAVEKLQSGAIDVDPEPEKQ